MPGLDYITQREVVTLLVPLLGGEEERRALLSLALGLHCPVLTQLDFKGATEIFILRLIEKLEAFGEIEPGKPALWALLEAIQERVGVDRQARIQALQPLLKPPLSPVVPLPGNAPPAVPPPSGVQSLPAETPPSPALPGPVPATAPLALRIFLASPGDVADERAIPAKAACSGARQ